MDTTYPDLVDTDIGDWLESISCMDSQGEKLFGTTDELAEGEADAEVIDLTKWESDLVEAKYYDMDDDPELRGEPDLSAIFPCTKSSISETSMKSEFSEFPRRSGRTSKKLVETVVKEEEKDDDVKPEVSQLVGTRGRRKGCKSYKESKTYVKKLKMHEINLPETKNARSAKANRDKKKQELEDLRKTQNDLKKQEKELNEKVRKLKEEKAKFERQLLQEKPLQHIKHHPSVQYFLENWFLPN